MNPDTPLVPRSVRDFLLPIVLVVAVLYFGREFFIPIALAILISFLLGPLIMRLERMHLGRVASVIVATLLAIGVIGGVGYIVAEQVIELADKLPSYKSNLQEKVNALRVPQNGAFSKAKKTLQELTASAAGDDLQGNPATKEIGQTQSAAGKGNLRTVKVNQPVPVTVVNANELTSESTSGPFKTVADFAAPILGPLGTTALVIVFVIFMLLEREDLRDRVIHLVGQGHLQVTTQALDEAARRVSRYLLAQTIVNVTYGVPIGVGLYFIGIPNAALWGLLATVLRFIPYVGSWISSFFPLALSLAIAPGSNKFFLTLGLFVVVELGTANIVEPWLYGASTGLSSMAVIVAAAFWTWLWGPVGLLLATPLTVCIAVLGKYIPALTFVDVLLGDHPPIAPEDRFYQRLLAGDEDEVAEIAERYYDKHNLAETFENLILPAMLLADEDYHQGVLLEPVREKLHALVSSLIADLGENTPPPGTGVETSALCIPASDYADEIIGQMLARLLALQGVVMQVIPSKLLASEMVEAVSESFCRLLCVSVLPPGSTRHGVYVSKRLRDRFPEARLLVGMWAEPPSDERGRLKRYQKVQIDGLFTSLQEMAKEVVSTATVVPVESVEAKAVPSGKA